MLVYKYVMLCETIALSFNSLLVDLLAWWFDFEWDIIHCQEEWKTVARRSSWGLVPA